MCIYRGADTGLQPQSAGTTETSLVISVATGRRMSKAEVRGQRGRHMQSVQSAAAVVRFIDMKIIWRCCWGWRKESECMKDRPWSAGRDWGGNILLSETSPTTLIKPMRLYQSPFQTIAFKVKQNSGEGRSGRLHPIYHRLAWPELPGSRSETFKRCMPTQNCLLLPRKIGFFPPVFLLTP